jgi:hypothetical protein
MKSVSELQGNVLHYASEYVKTLKEINNCLNKKAYDDHEGRVLMDKSMTNLNYYLSLAEHERAKMNLLRAVTEWNAYSGE